MTRTDPNLTDKLCAMIIAHFGINHEMAKSMDRKDILALVACDHYPVPVATAIAMGWTPEQYNHPSNLQLIMHATHDLKTAKKDVPQIAKSKRITADHEAFQRRLLAKSTGGEVIRDTTKKPWPQGRKMQSRPFQKKAPR